MTVFTTLKRIHRHDLLLKSDWKKLLKHLGKTKADKEPLPLITILDSHGLWAAIRCLGTVKGHDKELRLFAVACAREMQHLMKDQRSLDALDVAERYANGLATKEERKKARAAASAAADVVRSAYFDPYKERDEVALMAAYAPWYATSASAVAAASEVAEASNYFLSSEDGIPLRDEDSPTHAEIFRRIFG